MFSRNYGPSCLALAVAVLGLVMPCLAAVPAPWSETDVGAVGLTGSAAVSGGVWAVYGSGADIWGSADAFHFVYQPLGGNTQVVARVMGVASTHDWAKAGVMIREDLSPGSRHAFVCLTPSNGVAFQNRSSQGGVSENTNITGIAAPYWIKLVRTGDQFTAFRSADGSDWTQVGSARTIAMGSQVYVGLAATSHDNSRLGNAGFLDVQITSQGASGALFVTGSTLLNAGDAVVKKRLEILGYPVTVKAASAAVSADANGKALVVISSTVSSADVNTKFKASTVPVITWENAILDDMGMTGTAAGVDYGTAAAATDLNVHPTACDRATMYTAATNWGDGCHDLAAGLTATFGITRTAQPLTWGKPGAAAIRIAQLVGNSARSVIFAYEKGAAMPGLSTAPARRVAFFQGDNSASAWTGRGQSLFDRAVYWATGSNYAITKKLLVINFDPILEGQGGLRMHEWGRNRTGWWGGDPWPMTRDYLADLTEASGGYVRWQIVKYPAIPDYIDRWAPITGPVQFDSPSFSEQAFIDAYNYALDTWDWIGATQRMPNGGAFELDYHRILDDYGVDAKINSGEVDEVLIPNHPYSGSWESAMAGNQPYAVNGGTYYRNTNKNFVIMNLSYERGLSEVLENFGHRIEWTLSRIFHGYINTISYNRCYYPDWNRENEDPPPCGGSQQIPVLANLWDRISVVDGNLPGEAAVGAVHWAPNAQFRSDEYVWHKDNLVYSTADDWMFNYPNLAGGSTKRLVNVEEWRPMAQDGDAGRGFKKWWYFHMPRVPGRFSSPGNPMDDGKLNNWWEYMVNFNAHPESDN